MPPPRHPEHFFNGLLVAMAKRRFQTVRLGMKSLMLHKLRSILTTLGVLFGTSSVISMLAIGEGASYEAQEQIKLLGSQNVILRSVKPADDPNSSSTSTTGSESASGRVEMASPTTSGSSRTLAYSSRRTSGSAHVLVKV